MKYILISLKLWQYIFRSSSVPCYYIYFLQYQFFLFVLICLHFVEVVLKDMKIPGCPFTFISSTKADSEGLKKMSFTGKDPGCQHLWFFSWLSKFLEEDSSEDSSSSPEFYRSGCQWRQPSKGKRPSWRLSLIPPPVRPLTHISSSLPCTKFSFCWSTKLVTTYIGFYGYHNKDHTPGGLKQQKFTPPVWG